MRLKRMNKALLITTMVGFCLSANASQIAEDASVDYVTSVKSYLSNKVELSQELTSLIQDIQAKQSSLTRLQSALRSTESQIATIQRQNDTRPDRIRQLKGDILATKSSLDRLINRVAPGAFSAQDAIDILSGRLSRLQRQLEEVEGSIARRQRLFDQDTRNLRNDVNDLTIRVDNDRSRLSQLPSDISSAKREFRSADQKLASVREQGKSPQFDQKLADAQRHFDERNEARIRKGKSCGGLSGLTSSTCRKYRRAKDALKEVKRLRDPNYIASLESDVRKKQARLEKLLNSKGDIERRLKKNTQAQRRLSRRLERLEEDFAAETRPLRSERDDLIFSINRMSSSNGDISALRDLDSELASLKSELQRVENQPIQSTAGLERQAQQQSADISMMQEELAPLQARREDLSSQIASSKEDVTTKVQTLRESRDSIEELRERDEVFENLQNIMTSGQWQVAKSDMDANWQQSSCMAQTQASFKLAGVDSKAELEVVNLEGQSGDFLEPVVMITVNSEQASLADFKILSIDLGGRNRARFDLMYSMSSPGKLVFMSKLEDRASLISLMIRKNSLTSYVSNGERSDVIKFSLKGSTKAIRGNSASDQSLKNACGGIEIK